MAGRGISVADGSKTYNQNEYRMNGLLNGVLGLIAGLLLGIFLGLLMFA